MPLPSRHICVAVQLTKVSRNGPSELEWVLRLDEVASEVNSAAAVLAAHYDDKVIGDTAFQ